MIEKLQREIKGSSVLILGYGREGQSVHRFLCREAPNLRLGVADAKEVKLISESVPNTSIHSGPDYLSAIAQYDTIVRSPGISPLQLPADLSRGKHFTSLSNLFMAVAPGIIVGVTGTKGKSTTAALIHHLLETAYGDIRLVGNIGAPALDHLEGASAQTIFVMELSSFQLQDLRYSPKIAVLLEIFPEHLDYHGSLEAYTKAKLNISKYQVPDSHLVVHKSHQINIAQQHLPFRRTHFFDVSRGGRVEGFIEENALCLISEGGQTVRLLRTSEVPLIGKGNLLNTLAALITAKLLEVPVLGIISALSSFRPLEHRLEYVGEFHKIRFYNDSLSTIPQAAINALEALGADVETIILGGYDRGISYSALGPAILKSRLKTLILFPNTGQIVWQAVCQAAGSHAPLPAKFETESMEEAVSIAYRETSPGRVCLLSPAASSFNIFRDYQDRGESYKSWVRKLGG